MTTLKVLAIEESNDAQTLANVLDDKTYHVFCMALSEVTVQNLMQKVNPDVILINIRRTSGKYISNHSQH